jgi:hypothetical protein
MKKIDGFHLKILALIFMAIDHAGVIILFSLFPLVSPQTRGVLEAAYTIFRILGRVAYPLFAFMVVEALIHTRSKIRYIIQLLFMAALIGGGILVLDFYGVSIQAGNIFIDLSLAAMTIALLMHKLLIIKLLAVFTILAIFAMEFGDFFPNAFDLPNAFSADYGLYGFILTFGFYLAHEFKKRNQLKQSDWQRQSQFQLILQTNEYYYASISLILVNLLWYIISIVSQPSLNLTMIGIQSYSVFTILFINRYSGKLGKQPKWFKWFAYAFYPLHFAILFAILQLITLFL